MGAKCAVNLFLRVTLSSLHFQEAALTVFFFPAKSYRKVSKGHTYKNVTFIKTDKLKRDLPFKQSPISIAPLSVSIYGPCLRMHKIMVLLRQKT